MWCLPTSVCPSSDCCLSRDHISETKKDRPIVIMEHYKNWHCWFCCCIQILPTCPLGRYSGFRLKICSYVYMACCLNLTSTECDCHNVLLEIVVISQVLCWQHLCYDATVEQEVGQLLIAVAIFVLLAQWCTVSV